MGERPAPTDRMRLPAARAATWVALAACTALGLFDLSAIKLLFALGPLVVVPLALELLRWRSPRAERLRHVAGRLMPIGALAVAASLPMSPGGAATALALPWFAVCGLVSLSGLIELFEVRRFQLVLMVRVIAAGYLTFGAGWLLLSRFGAQPLDFPDAIVELTAVHFHFAGFAAPIIATAAAIHTGSTVARRLALLGGVGVVTAMPVVALGITTSLPLAAAGASFLGVSLTFVALGNATMLRRGELNRRPSVLLAMSSASVVVAMVLAVQYTFGQALGTPSLTIDQMARTHGILNGAGFALCGLLAWHAQTRERARVR